MRRYGSIDEIAKEYALTNEQLLDYLLSNDIDAISDLAKIDLNNKNIMAILDKLDKLQEKKNTLMQEYSSTKSTMDELYQIRKHYGIYMGKEMER